MIEQLHLVLVPQWKREMDKLESSVGAAKAVKLEHFPCVESLGKLGSGKALEVPKSSPPVPMGRASG